MKIIAINLSAALAGKKRASGLQTSSVARWQQLHANFVCTRIKCALHLQAVVRRWSFDNLMRLWHVQVTQVIAKVMLFCAVTVC